MENSGPIQKHVIDWNDTDFFRWPGLRLISAEDGVSRVELPVEKHHRGGGSLVYCEGRVWDESGKTGATCTGIYRIFRRR